MRRVPLLTRRVAIGLQDCVDKRPQRIDHRTLVFDLLALRRFRARQCLTHHSPMYPKLVRHSPDRPEPELVFPANLLEQLHLCPPLHPSPPASSAVCWVSRGGANLQYRKGPFHSIEISLRMNGAVHVIG